MSENELRALPEHERFMRRCIELAKIAQTQDNSPVGSIVVVDGEVVGEGSEGLPAGNSITGHAEVVACQSAADKTGSRVLRGATLYTTAEPCFMCSYVIRQCEFVLVVYGVQTPDTGGVTSTHPILTDEGLSSWSAAPRVLGGVLEDECKKIRSA